MTFVRQADIVAVTCRTIYLSLLANQPILEPQELQHDFAVLDPASETYTPIPISSDSQHAITVPNMPREV